MSRAWPTQNTENLRHSLAASLTTQMCCEEVKSRLGELLDNELPADAREPLHRHLDQCADCAREYQWLRSMAAALAPAAVPVPIKLWDAIAQRLDAAHSPAGKSRPCGTFSLWRRWRPLAFAAALMLAVGAAWLVWQAPLASTAVAAQIDFRPLLERADQDVAAGIRALLESYGGKTVSLADASRQMKVRVHAPERLPLGLELRTVHLLNMGRHHVSLAQHFVGPAGHLLLLQCPPGLQKNYGNYECLPCQVGAHDGHVVRVGNLRLMHIESENVCVCVVSTLDEQTQLPAVLDMFRIEL